MRGGFGEENKSRRVVRVVASVFLVEARPEEKLALVDEINAELRGNLMNHHSAAHARITKRNLHLPIERLDCGKTLGQSAIQRCHHSDLWPAVRERFCQGTDHVGQSACFGVRMDLAADEQNSHAWLVTKCPLA